MTVIASDALPILGDHIQLQQVILNLVVNGIDAMRNTPRENRVMTIIEAHEGLISARNQVHGGASFRIKLPIVNNGARAS